MPSDVLNIINIIFGIALFAMPILTRDVLAKNSKLSIKSKIGIEIQQVVFLSFVSGLVATRWFCNDKLKKFRNKKYIFMVVFLIGILSNGLIISDMDLIDKEHKNLVIIIAGSQICILVLLCVLNFHFSE